MNYANFLRRRLARSVEEALYGQQPGTATGGEAGGRGAGARGQLEDALELLRTLDGLKQAVGEAGNFPQAAPEVLANGVGGGGEGHQQHEQLVDLLREELAELFSRLSPEVRAAIRRAYETPGTVSD